MENLDTLLLALPVLLLSLTAHEFAHAWVALRQGDDTAYMLGRVSMNPAAHVDPIGTLLFPTLAILFGAPVLGWAKPVPTNPRKFRVYRRGEILVSIAGVTANAILAVCFAVLIAVLVAVAGPPQLLPETLSLVFRVLYFGVYINIILIFFNLLPIPPLDGSHVMYHMLPPDLGAQYRRLYPYGMFILWGLVLVGGFRWLVYLVNPVIDVLLTPAAMVL